MKSYYSAWDIGGAHLKCAILNQQGELIHVEQVATPLWKGINVLREAINHICTQYELSNAQHAITTTAELVDGFADREKGIQEILNLTKEQLGYKTLVYSNAAGLIKLETAQHALEQVASANWHATVNYLSCLSSTGLLIDIGSTTTDIIPFTKGKLLNRSNTDQQRLRTGEMLYTGVVRTPVMAICQQAEYKGIEQYLMAELFANMADVYRVTGELLEEDDMYPSCDGQEKSTEASARRLGRMLGIDSALDQAMIEFAETISNKQKEMIQKSIKTILSREKLTDNICLYSAGSGGFLVKQIASELGMPHKSFAKACNIDESLHHVANRSAPAVALAKLMY